VPDAQTTGRSQLSVAKGGTEGAALKVIIGLSPTVATPI